MANLDTTAKRRSAVFRACRAVYPVANATITEPDRRHVCREYSAHASTAGIAYTNYGSPFYYESAHWTARYFYLEVYMRAAAGTVYADLYDLTASASVAGSRLFTSSATFVRKRSGSVSLTDLHEYVVRFGRTTADAGEAKSAHLVVM